MSNHAMHPIRTSKSFLAASQRIGWDHRCSVWWAGHLFWYQNQVKHRLLLQSHWLLHGSSNSSYHVRVQWMPIHQGWWSNQLVWPLLKAGDWFLHQLHEGKDRLITRIRQVHLRLAAVEFVPSMNCRAAFCTYRATRIFSCSDINYKYVSTICLIIYRMVFQPK